ncbi:NAD(P)/FAD-dependent oxidoreductase [Exiguobacterium profundum]|uniref:HI0933 family protein n=1 Tax=Exiguobacterium sp. (strain ATCC BAA-1283 / AT1b) TaxID=360911 RepID=C4L4R6_EXISA|nr:MULTISPECIES: aminoacetone oxidase family FAD-binding enzyme [Exiguobacterium]ACQ69661.1 HI0933 family protein [Exiguobacterium sp. AT1b]MDX5981692.1 NAD(P)/FAD-dependent oxidoreductase [Exiguobacterium profundum]QUP88099.1 NAD(P)/FAD-dependent oxidoreductase [Exiguobacterium sp. PFWT01]
MKDVIVIGGGPSGLMATYAAAKSGASTLLIDKGSKLGRKLAISGGGRCNVTNRKPIDELIQFIPGNGRFLYSALAQFDNQSIIDLFTGFGIPLKEEDNGRMFPVTDKAQDVVNTLLRAIEDLGVEIRKKAEVKTLHFNEENEFHAVELMDGEMIEAKACVVAVGGQSVPHTGSTGDGYPWAEKAGHTITELFPTEVPIKLNDSFIGTKQLQGLSLRDVALTVHGKKGKAIKTHQGDMIFTHFGISGPIALRCSQYTIKERKRSKEQVVLMSLDFFPDTSRDALVQELWNQVQSQPKRAVKNVWKGYIPERLLDLLLEELAFGEEDASQLKKQSVIDFASRLKMFEMHAVGTLDFDKAFVTGGGVSVKEVAPQTMMSKKAPGLFFAGEVLDIHGYTGGYNITAAFTTGHCAGSHAAELATER